VFLIFETVDREPNTNLVERDQLNSVQHEIGMHIIMIVLSAGI